MKKAPALLDLDRVSPHNVRRLGSRVLITEDAGRCAFLSEAEYRDYLAGLSETHPRFSELQGKGFVKSELDFDALAAGVRGAGLLGWSGPSTHVLSLEAGGAVMTLETARLVVDFAFSSPGPQVTLELSCRSCEASWPVLWFIVQYARRRGEWARRPLFLILRCREKIAPERVEFLRGHGVTRRLVLDAAGPPVEGPAAFPAQRALCRVGPSAKEPAAWVDWLSREGFDSVRFVPPAGTFPAGLRRFLGFYAAALDRMIETAEVCRTADEWAGALLSRAPWALPGTDVLEELAYDPSGAIFSSEGGLALGQAGRTRYEDLAAVPAVGAVLAACHAGNQPRCEQCVYKSFCTIPPALSHRLQGTVWGQTPASFSCALHMGILDIVFSRIDSEKLLPLLNKWSVDNPK